MLFGRDLNLPADLMFSRPPDVTLASEEYIEKLLARGWRKCIIWLGKDLAWLLRRKRPDTTQELLDTICTKATKCGYGIRNVTKDSLRSCRPTRKVLTQS
ncbi:hypothetical protein TNCV_5001971 [Trichonephila clavipes]|nr:hypothetical protein TNCV_5001971 [Trichonephila clavipes]